MFEFSPMVTYKLLNRTFDLNVLRAIFTIQNQRGSLIGLPAHPTSWGWASRRDIARLMGHRVLTKSLSRKIYRAMVWLTAKGYLRFKSINTPGNFRCATLFLIAYWVFRQASESMRVVCNEVKALCRTPNPFKGTKPTHTKGISELFKGGKLGSWGNH